MNSAVQERIRRKSSRKIQDLKLSVFGLGKLGIPLVAGFISKGFHVIGTDVDRQKVDALGLLKSPVYENGVGALLIRYGKNLSVTTDSIEIVKETDVTFIVVATPTGEDGTFSNQYVLDACRGIAKGLKEKKSYHLIVVTSTLMPASMEGVVQPCLEKESGKRAGVDFGLCYNPEFIALGSVIRDFLNPDFILIGESDREAGDLLSRLYQNTCENNPAIARMNFINAELTKLALNSFVTTKISFANMLARISEKLPGANVDVITQALGLDSRIGRKYLKGAISYGGPCFPRDNVALTRLAEKMNVPCDIAKAVDHFNRWQIKWLSDCVISKLGKTGKVGILGLTYKQGSNVVEESAGLLLACELIQQNVSVNVYDPAGEENAKRILGSKVHYEDSLQCSVRESDVLVITTPLEEFAHLPELIGKENGKNKIVIDCWRFLDPPSNELGFKYIPLGIGLDS